MKAVVSIVIAGFALAVSTYAQDGSAATYDAMVQRVKDGDLSVDFRALRLACMEDADCRPRSSKQELSALVTQDHRKGIAAGERLLAQGYANAELHATLAGHYQALGDTANLTKAAFHQRIFTGLLQSILNSGNGRSPESAWVIISDREQYMVLAFLGYPYSGPNVVNVSAITQGRHKYNRWQVKGATGATTFYFNTDAFRDKSVLGGE